MDDVIYMHVGSVCDVSLFPTSRILTYQSLSLDSNVNVIGVPVNYVTVWFLSMLLSVGVVLKFFHQSVEKNPNLSGTM